jgi:hypothetical protein
MSIFLKTPTRLLGFIIDFIFFKKEKKGPLSIFSFSLCFLRQTSTFTAENDKTEFCP